MNMMNEYKMSDRLYVIPQANMETRTALLNVDRSTKEDIRNTYHFHVDHDWQCNTIATVYIESLIKSLAIEVKSRNNGNAAINFFDLLTAAVSVKRNEDAEKEGNINITFSPGPNAVKIINEIVPTVQINTDSEDSELFQTVPREDLSHEYVSALERFGGVFKDDDSVKSVYERLDAVARMDLSEKYSIGNRDLWMVTAIAYTFIENIFRQLVYNIAITRKPSASINFNDNIEMHALLKGGQIIISMRPGMNAKLLIKSDETTEYEENED